MSLNAASKHHYSPETKEKNMHELGSQPGHAHGQTIGTENVFYVHLNASVHIKGHTLMSRGAYLGVLVLLKNSTTGTKTLLVKFLRIFNSARAPQELSMRHSKPMPAQLRSRTISCSPRSVMLPEEIGKCLLTLSLAKPKYSAEGILKT
jgi:hypothetical protein